MQELTNDDYTNIKLYCIFPISMAHRAFNCQCFFFNKDIELLIHKNALTITCPMRHLDSRYVASILSSAVVDGLNKIISLNDFWCLSMYREMRYITVEILHSRNQQQTSVVLIRKQVSLLTSGLGMTFSARSLHFISELFALMTPSNAPFSCCKSNVASRKPE